MATLSTYHIEFREDEWAVVKEGATQASFVEATREAALSKARDFARSRQPSRLIVHNMDGSVQDEISFGAEDTNGQRITRKLKQSLPDVDTGALIQEVKVRGDQLVDRIREIVAEGNARRVVIRKEGRSVLEVPLSVGVGGAAAAIVFSPVLAALGAFAALVNDVDILVERIPEAERPALTE